MSREEQIRAVSLWRQRAFRDDQIAPLSVIGAEFVSRSLNEMYVLARLPDAPSPVGFPGRVAVYSIVEWLVFLGFSGPMGA